MIADAIPTGPPPTMIALGGWVRVRVVLAVVFSRVDGEGVFVLVPVVEDIGKGFIVLIW
jgi:hypothetical protein